MALNVIPSCTALTAGHPTLESGILRALVCTPNKQMGNLLAQKEGHDLTEVTCELVAKGHSNESLLLLGQSLPPPPMLGNTVCQNAVL